MNFWDRVSKIYDYTEALNGSVYREMKRRTLRIIPDGAKVLDCAAGTGELSLSAAKRASHVTCTDVSIKMLEEAVVKAKKFGLDNISFKERDITALDEPDGEYDVVMAGNVLHLVDEPEKVVAELLRVTKSGGMVLVPCFMTGKRSRLIEFYNKFGFNAKHGYTPTTYIEMLRGAGCEKIKAKFIEGPIPCLYTVIYKD